MTYRPFFKGINVTKPHFSKRIHTFSLQNLIPRRYKQIAQPRDKINPVYFTTFLPLMI